MERIPVVCYLDSEIVGPIKLKLGGMIEGMGENILAKEFLDQLKLTRVRSVGHKCIF